MPSNQKRSEPEITSFSDHLFHEPLPSMSGIHTTAASKEFSEGFRSDSLRAEFDGGTGAGIDGEAHVLLPVRLEETFWNRKQVAQTVLQTAVSETQLAERLAARLANQTETPPNSVFSLKPYLTAAGAVALLCAAAAFTFVDTTRDYSGDTLRRDVAKKRDALLDRIVPGRQSGVSAAAESEEKATAFAGVVGAPTAAELLDALSAEAESAGPAKSVAHSAPAGSVTTSEAGDAMTWQDSLSLYRALTAPAPAAKPSTKDEFLARLEMWERTKRP